MIFTVFKKFKIKINEFYFKITERNITIIMHYEFFSSKFILILNHYLKQFIDIDKIVRLKKKEMNNKYIIE